MSSKKEEKQKKEKQKKEPVVRKTFWFMLKIAKKEKPGLFAAYFMMLIGNLLGTAQWILLPGFLVNELVEVIAKNDAQLHLKKAVFWVFVTIITMLVSRFLSQIGSQMRSVYNEWFNEYFEVMLSEKTMQMDFQHTEDPQVLNDLSRAKDGISWYSGGLVGILNGFFDAIVNILTLIGISTVILFSAPLLFPVQLLGLLFISFFNAKNNKIEIGQYSKLSVLNRIFGYYLYTLPDFTYGKEVRLYESENLMVDRATEMTNDQMRVWYEMAHEQLKNRWGMDVTNAARDAVSYFYLGFLTLAGRITLGEFTMCVNSASGLYRGMTGFVTCWQNIVKGCNYAYQFIKFLDYPDAFCKGDEKIKEGEHVIEFSHVSFRYPRSENYVLKDINLTIRSGEHLSIVGLNGAGKTTFVKLLCRLYDVTEGEIKIDGINIREYSEEEYHKLFSVVFQDFFLFAFSLRDNVCLGKEAKEEELERVLELSGLTEDVKKLSNGADTILYKSFDEKGTELSGGQQQKVAIARALQKNSPIVILDEPTAALDPIAEYDIYRKFDNLVGGKTAIYISHRLSSCKFCDAIAVFADNTIREYGTHNELVKKENGIYAKMFAAQAQYYLES